MQNANAAKKGRGPVLSCDCPELISPRCPPMQTVLSEGKWQLMMQAYQVAQPDASNASAPRVLSSVFAQIIPPPLARLTS